ncbi:RsbRD N-terminal domain-containing protein [Melioribacteraceae bacterium 4301-Me]|uniref:RsbRD N-terminal domain-containing protein n=1 Tax=Pyranulibacter aquaticus TaxID=3163344 RepID=UPI00359B4430
MNKFVHLVENNAHLLTSQWVEEVKRNPSTKGYRNLSEAELRSRVFDVYKRLGEWLQSDENIYQQTAQHFFNLGKTRAKEGLKVSEVVYALILNRVILWKFVINNGIIDTAIDYHHAIDFYHKVTNFFDKAEYFVCVGYETLDKTAEKKLEDENFFEAAVSAITNWVVKEPK